MMEQLIENIDPSVLAKRLEPLKARLAALLGSADHSADEAESPQLKDDSPKAALAAIASLIRAGRIAEAQRDIKVFRERYPRAVR